MRAFVPLYLAVNYLLFAFTASLGVLQAAGVASRDHRLTLVPPQRPRLGLAVAAFLIGGAYAVYWFCAPELLTPGPAGAELTTLFVLAALPALGVTRLLARLRSATIVIPTALASNRPLPQATGSHAPSNPQSPIPNPQYPIPNTQHALRITYYVLPSLLIGLFDLPLFRLLNGLAGHSAVFDATVQFLMNDYIVPTALVLTLLGLWFSGATWSERAWKQSTVLRALLAMLLASIILKLINEIYFRPRPFTWNNVTLLFYHPSDSSFPGNAATVGFSLAMTVWLRCRRWGIWMLLLASAMGIARVCGGVHFPLDVVAGAWLGGLAAWGVNRSAWLDAPLNRALALARRMRVA